MRECENARMRECENARKKDLVLIRQKATTTTQLCLCSPAAVTPSSQRAADPGFEPMISILQALQRHVCSRTIFATNHLTMWKRLLAGPPTQPFAPLLPNSPLTPPLYNSHFPSPHSSNLIPQT